MGKAQEVYNKYLQDRPDKLNKLSEANMQAKTKANEAQIKAYTEADEAYSKALTKLEDEGIKLQKAAAAETDLEFKENNASEQDSENNPKE